MAREHSVSPRNVGLFAILVVVVLGAIQGQPSVVRSELETLQITISPPNPTDSDRIELTVSGGLSCVNETVVSSSAVMGNIIDIVVDVVHPEVCLTAVGEFDAIETVGPLPAGEYSVLATLNDECCWPCNPPPCVESARLTVTAGPATLPQSGGPPMDARGSNHVPIAAGVISSVALGALLALRLLWRTMPRHRI